MEVGKSKKAISVYGIYLNSSTLTSFLLFIDSHTYRRYYSLLGWGNILTNTLDEWGTHTTGRKYHSGRKLIDLLCCLLALGVITANSKVSWDSSSKWSWKSYMHVMCLPFFIGDEGGTQYYSVDAECIFILHTSWRIVHS